MSIKTIDKLRCEDCGVVWLIKDCGTVWLIEDCGTVWPLNELTKKMAMPAEETEKRCPKCGSANLMRACKKLDTCPRIRALGDMSEEDQQVHAIRTTCKTCEDYER